MKKPNQLRCHRRVAFTLVELLVVIAILGILAALVFPALKMAKEKGLRAKAQTELKQIAAAIDSYKAKYGHYPPDNAANAAPDQLNPTSIALNQLFYELQGTVIKGNSYDTLDGRASITAATALAAFGVGGFVNCTKAGGGDDFAAAQKFISGLKPGQYGFLSTGVGLLTTSVPWPKSLGPVIAGWPDELNPIRYNSSSPTNNAKSYDLWVDIVLGGKTNRISNWNAQPEFVNN